MKTEVEFISADEVKEAEEVALTDVITREPWEETLSGLATAPGTKITVPRNPSIKREQVVNAFLDAFQLIGGTPRLALWADENPTEFFKLWAKLAPRQVEQETKHDGGLKILHVLPRGKLDE